MNKDGRTTIQVSNNRLISIVKSSSDAILLSSYTPLLIEDADGLDKFHINLARLDKGIRCVKSETFSQFSVENNYLEYKDSSIKFVVKLLSPNMIPDIPKISAESVENHPIDGTILITHDHMKDLMRAKSFTPENKKMYIYHDGTTAIFEFGDRELDHKDNMKIYIENSCTGTFDTSIFENSLLDLFFRNKCDKLFKIGARALIVDIDQDNSKLTYLTPKLKK